MGAFASFLDLLLPRRCQLCGTAAGDGGLCGPCEDDLPWLGNACQRCALPLPENTTLCGRCLKRPPAFDRCRAVFRYAPPVDRLIGQFKHQRHLTAGRLLARLAANRLCQPGEEPDLIGPVPLHWRRQLLRGFNQSALVAEILSRKLDIPLAPLAIRRQSTTQQQALGRRERLRNLRDAFVARPSAVAGKHVVIVDDVVTTSATAEALSRQLKQVGARRVEVWALARTPAPGLR